MRSAFAHMLNKSIIRNLFSHCLLFVLFSNDIAEIEKVVDSFKGNIPRVEWDFEKIHYLDYGPRTVQYIFVLDTLNFCFWPGMNNWSYLLSSKTVIWN
jgi:Potential Queuosine, Q, salvage protein family